jgi:hypothetical protein
VETKLKYRPFLHGSERAVYKRQSRGRKSKSVRFGTTFEEAEVTDGAGEEKREESLPFLLKLAFQITLNGLSQGGHS